MAQFVSIMKLPGSISNTFLGMLSRCRCERREKQRAVLHESHCHHHRTTPHAFTTVVASFFGCMFGLVFEVGCGAELPLTKAAQSPPRMFDAVHEVDREIRSRM